VLTAALAPPGARLTALFVGAHPDDIEIGCGGAVLRWIREGIIARAHWIVLSGAGTEREQEARAGASAFLRGLAADSVVVEVESLTDGYFPYSGNAVKDVFERLKSRVEPNLILAPRRDDAHQDHRLASELTWNTFRDHLVMEYEIPKYDGDLGQPNLYVSLPEWAVTGKLESLLAVFRSQADRPWFDAGVFRGLMRLRGAECRSASGFAEGLYVRKLLI
jgi:LmbE family N-acetylglucosaminyl deacetylase